MLFFLSNDHYTKIFPWLSPIPERAGSILEWNSGDITFLEVDLSQERTEEDPSSQISSVLFNEFFIYSVLRFIFQFIYHSFIYISIFSNFIFPLNPFKKKSCVRTRLLTLLKLNCSSYDSSYSLLYDVLRAPKIYINLLTNFQKKRSSNVRYTNWMSLYHSKQSNFKYINQIAKNTYDLRTNK